MWGTSGITGISGLNRAVLEYHGGTSTLSVLGAGVFRSDPLLDSSGKSSGPFGWEQSCPKFCQRYQIQRRLLAAIQLLWVFSSCSYFSFSYSGGRPRNLILNNLMAFRSAVIVHDFILGVHLDFVSPFQAVRILPCCPLCQFFVFLFSLLQMCRTKVIDLNDGVSQYAWYPCTANFQYSHMTQTIFWLKVGSAHIIHNFPLCLPLQRFPSRQNIAPDYPGPSCSFLKCV